jgi:hypothetical protein
MNYEEKFQAINALCEASLLMRKPGDWYVSQSTEIKNGSVLEGRYGNGITPETAIEDHWEALTNLDDHEYVVFRKGEERQAVKWNGFMWENLSEQIQRIMEGK